MTDTYSLLREIADSWVLLAMTLFFLGACLWVFRPGSGPLHRDAADTIFREPARPDLGCDKNCANCAPTLEFQDE